MDERPIIEVRGIGKRYAIGAAVGGKRKQGGAEEHVWALKDVSFNIRRGERVGIIGRNGAGKSTLLKILSRVVYPTEGEARIRGRLTALLEVGSGFSDTLTGRENIFLNATLYGLSREEVAARLDDIIAFSEVGRFIDTPIKYYSTGMRARLGFAVAAHLDPDILLLDEVLAVGDMAFQRKCLERMEEVTSAGRTLLFVSHSMDSVTRFCERCIWIENGRVKLDSDATAAAEAYAEAYLGVSSSLSGAEIRRKSPANAVSVGEAADAVELLEATVIDSRNAATGVVSSDEAVGIRMRFEVKRRGVYLPAVGIFNEAGVHAFQSAPTNTNVSHYALEAGVHECVVWIPPDLLNTGTYTISLHVVDPRYSPLVRHVRAERVLSFYVAETKLSEHSPRSLFAGAFPGVLRPALKWVIAPFPADRAGDVKADHAVAKHE